MTTCSCGRRGRSRSATQSCPVIPRWTRRVSPASVSSSRYLLRRLMPVTVAPRSRARPRGATGSRSLRSRTVTPRTRRPTRSGPRPPRIGSISGSSGTRIRPGTAGPARQDPLLLQIALVDARERLRDDRRAAEIARGHGGVLAARALAVVLVSHDDPPLPRRLVGAGHLGHVHTALPGQKIGRLAALAGEGV